MKKAKKPIVEATESFPPAKNSEEREDQLISLAYDAAEKHLREGTATSQEIVHFLKLGSRNGRLNDELIATQIELAKAKSEALQSSARVEKLYAEAVKAFASYNGQTPNDSNDET